MSWEAWGTPDDDDYGHLIEAGWWADGQVEEVTSAIKALVGTTLYEGGDKANGVSVEFLIRLTLLQYAAGLDVPPAMVSEAEAHFAEKT